MKLACSSCCSINSIDVIYVQHLCLISLMPTERLCFVRLTRPTLDCTTSQDDLNVQKMLFNYALTDSSLTCMRQGIEGRG